MSFFKNLFKGNKEQEVKKEQIVPLTNGELVNTTIGIEDFAFFSINSTSILTSLSPTLTF